MGTDIHPIAEVKVNGRWQRADIEVPDDRNYYAFSVLAGVRNETSLFARAWDTGDPITPIDEPRGLPDDCTVNSDTDIGDHSYSWVTLDELLAVELDQSIKRTALVYRRYLGTPIYWHEPLRKSAWLIPKIIEALKPLGEPDKVRLVFGFDS